MPNKTFNLEKIYDAEIAPQMREIVATCRRAGMPMLASFGYASGVHKDARGIDYITAVVGFKDGSIPDELKEAACVILNSANKKRKAVKVSE